MGFPKTRKTEKMPEKFRAADLLVKCLENEGVKYIFGIPGEVIMIN